MSMKPSFQKRDDSWNSRGLYIERGGGMDITVMYVAHGDEVEKNGEWCRDLHKDAHTSKIIIVIKTYSELWKH